MLDKHLHALIGERHPLSAPAALRQAEGYLLAQFQDLGLRISTHAFRALGGAYCNVIGTMLPQKGGGGDSPPSAWGLSPFCDAPPPLIIAAHYDTVPGSPGADDNASGLAVMLEVARSLRGTSLNREVRFIAFCLEEEDLLGSLAYAASLRASDQELYGAIVLECVGYTCCGEESQRVPPGVPVAVPSVGDFLAIVGNTTSAGLVKAVETAARQSVPALKTVSLVVPDNGEPLPDTRRSDHAAFWQYGYPAVMLTDTANFRNPHYHRPTDTLDTLDLHFMQRVAQAVIAAVLHLSDSP
jgi:Zn-dependent M28 family amino/carboxypeptidase